jgi:hypothetical protein
MKLAFLLKIFSSISTQMVKDKDVFYAQKAMKRVFHATVYAISCSTSSTKQDVTVGIFCDTAVAILII